MVLPAGAVTFVFTDIEGSTRLFRALGDDYPALLDRHRELLRAEWARHGGHEVDTEGDSFFVAFADAGAALAACADAQRALAAEEWPVAQVRVRMGVHSGVAFPRGDDYVAFAVHQAARVVNVAHGGQIVVSADTAEEATLPTGHRLDSLGSYRVRDFDEPVELFQLNGPGLGTEFPALRALPADRHNLAVPLTRLVGRAPELERLGETVVPGRVVTIVGPGGAGKTRVAIEHGLRRVESWPDGVWFIDLSAVDADPLVASAVAGALGIRLRPDGDSSGDVVEHLRRRRCLLVIDNAEHVRAAVATLVLAILGASPGVGVLVTSREPIGLRAESVLRLGVLPEAAELYVERATAAGATLPADRTTIDELCRRLDGLPLAIEMAAARAPMLTPADILAGLGSEAPDLVSRDPTSVSRHRSLDDLLAWSDRLLAPRESWALRRLAAFAGSFGYDTAAVALGGDGLDRADAAELVWSLANRSLLVIDTTAGGTRYRFAETVRTYARRHDPVGDVAAAAADLAAWYLSTVGPACSFDRDWVARTGEEMDNLRGVLALVAHADQAPAQELAWTIGQYHDLVQAYRHGIDEIDRYAAMLDAPTPSRVGLLTRLADLRLRVGDVDRASAAATAARELQERVGPAPWDETAVDRTEGEIMLAGGDADAVIRLAEAVLVRDLSDRSQSRMWNLLAVARFVAGDFAGSADAARRELAVLERLGLGALLVSTHSNVAEALLCSGDRRGAARHQREALRLALQFGQPVIVAYSMIVAGRLAATTGDWDVAVRLQAAADARLAEIGTVMYPQDRAAVDDLLREATGVLAPDQLAAETRRGRTESDDTLRAITDAVLAAVANAHEMETPTHA